MTSSRTVVCIEYNIPTHCLIKNTFFFVLFIWLSVYISIFLRIKPLQYTYEFIFFYAYSRLRTGADARRNVSIIVRLHVTHLLT